MQTGRYGESLAVAYFIGIGYEILHRNWRHKRLEVDIIAVKDAVLHFIEVKTRTSGSFGPPEESVTEKKLRSLIDASAAYLYIYPHWEFLRSFPYVLFLFYYDLVMKAAFR